MEATTALTAQKPTQPPEVQVRLLGFELENVKRVSFAEYTFDENQNMVVIAGPNGSGKSSVLEGVKDGLGFRDTNPAELITTKNGVQRKLLRVTLTFNLFTVVRRRPRNGSPTLVIKDARTNKDIPSPRAFLAKLFSPVMVDPGAFAFSYDNKKRLTALYQITGIQGEITRIATEEEKNRKARTELTREINTLAAQVGSEVMEAELAEMDPAALMKELEDEQARETEYTKEQEHIKNLMEGAEGIKEGHKETIADMKQEITEKEEEIKQLEYQIADTLKAVSELEETLKDCEASLSKPAPVFRVEEIKAKFARITEHNARARAIIERNGKRAEHDAKYAKRKEVNAAIVKAEKDKIAALQAARLPEELTIEDGKILINGLPWSNLSNGEAIMMAFRLAELAPEPVKLMTIDISQLDNGNRAFIKKYLDEHPECTAFLHEVTDDPEPGMLYMRDGEAITIK